MLRKLGIVGLAVPLIAFVGVLVYLSLFGTEEPTFDAATRELARDYTVVRLQTEPPAAMVAPASPVGAVLAVVVLPDDERHVWSALRALGLLDYVEDERIVLIPAVGPVETLAEDDLWELVNLAGSHVEIDAAFIAAFDGEPLAEVCQGDGPAGEWSGVAAASSEPSSALVDTVECGELPVWRAAADSELAASMVQWMLDAR